VICLLDEQRTITDKGGTMRLGTQTTKLDRRGRSFACYGQETVFERHRHRYEFNSVYRQQLAAHGMLISGTSPDGALVEVVEIPDHPWFVAVQYHPEFKSKPTAPQPLFAGFIEAAVQRRAARAERTTPTAAHAGGTASSHPGDY
jgi:CTP synthase